MKFLIGERSLKSPHYMAQQTATKLGGKETPTTTPFAGSLDMSEGALGYTCSGTKATLITPDGELEPHQGVEEA